jgi:hypothetical protein
MHPITSHQPGITSQELKEAIPDNLLSRSVHLQWVDKKPAGEGSWLLSAKIVIDGNVVLLQSKTSEVSLIEDWDLNDPTHHTNARLLALERILTDPANEDILLKI